jgi:hypothetical protein
MGSGGGIRYCRPRAGEYGRCIRWEGCRYIVKRTCGRLVMVGVVPPVNSRPARSGRGRFKSNSTRCGSGRDRWSWRLVADSRKALGARLATRVVRATWAREIWVRNLDSRSLQRENVGSHKHGDNPTKDIVNRAGPDPSTVLFFLFSVVVVSPIVLNLFMKWLMRVRVVPTISAKVS